MAWAFGFVTIDGKKVASLEEVQVEATRDEDAVFVTDNNEADEIIPTVIKYKVSAKVAYTTPMFFKAMREGKVMGGVLYKKEGSAKPEPVRDLVGMICTKNVLGPLNGNKHVIEDLDFTAAKIRELD